MQGDTLLDEWKNAKKICYKIIQISKNANIYSKVSEKPMERQTKQEYISVYDTVYKLCITKQKQETRVVMVYKEFKQILKNALLEMSQQLKTEKDIHKLKHLRKIWQAYSDILKRLMHMFAFLNRPFNIKEGRIQELQKTGITIIVTTLLGQNAILEYEGIYFKEIDRIRKTHDFANAQVIKDFVDILYKIHLKLIKNVHKKMVTRYTEFYAKYIKFSREYYASRHNSLKQLNPAEYFEQVDGIYNLQQKIGVDCFGVGGQTLINKEFSENFIQKYRDTLMSSEKGLKLILKTRQINALKIIIEMYSKLTKNIQGFKEQFEEFIFQDVKSFLQEMKTEILIKRNPNTYTNFMQKLMNKNREYLQILSESFMHLGDFLNYYKTGVQKAFINVKLPIHIEQILVIFIDSRFKMASLQQNQANGTIKDIESIFVCIENKDLFMARYTQKLTKRLLQATPELICCHEAFVEKLKLNCGIKYTERVETLLYEYSLIQENQPLIKKISTEKKLNIDFNVKIFSEGAWPTTQIIDIPLHYFPDPIERAVEVFNCYREEYSNKKSFKISFSESKIRWLYYFDEAVENKFPQCYFETNCLQGAILYYIYKNRPHRIGIGFLMKHFDKVPQKFLRDNINKMVDVAECILIRSNDNGEAFFEFNSKMKSNKRLISYDTVSGTEEEKLFQQQDLGKDRQLVLDANIAKLMKSRKVTDFETLFAEIQKMIKTFNPQKRDIKIAIDRLISKELLQRDEKDQTKIKYID